MSNVLGARNGSGPDADELSLDGFSTDDDEGTNGGEYLDLDLARKTTAANRDSVTSLLGFSEYDDNELAAGYLDIDVVQQQAASIRESMNMSDYDDDETEDEDEGGGGYLQLGHGGANAGVTGPTPIVEPWEVFDAIVEDDEEELEVLIELGADVNIVDKEGYTPLQQAVMLGYQSMVAVLYDNGADLNQTNRAGQTALDMAVIGSKKKIARALSTHGAKHSANFVPPEAPTGLMKQGSFSGLVVGKKCTVKGYMGAGTIRFVGKHKIKNTDICGIELELKVGKNNGTVMGTKYFECPNRHGILCPSWKVTTKETPKPAQDDPISVVVSTARDVGGRPDSYSGFESPPTSPGPGSAVKYRDSLRGFGEGNQRPDSFAGFESDDSGESRTDEPSNGPIEPEAVQYGPGAYIQKVTKAGPAAQTGQFKVGMWVASLNGQDCMGLTKHDVIEIIKGAEQLLTFGLVFEGAASTGRIVVNGKIGLSFEDRMGVPAPDSSAPGAAIPEAASPASVSSIDMHTYDGKGRLALVGVLRKRGIYYDKARGKDPEYLYLDLGLHTQYIIPFVSPIIFGAVPTPPPTHPPLNPRHTCRMTYPSSVHMCRMLTGACNPMLCSFRDSSGRACCWVPTARPQTCSKDYRARSAPLRPMLAWLPSPRSRPRPPLRTRLPVPTGSRSGVARAKGLASRYSTTWVRPSSRESSPEGSPIAPGCCTRGFVSTQSTASASPAQKRARCWAS